MSSRVIDRILGEDPKEPPGRSRLALAELVGTGRTQLMMNPSVLIIPVRQSRSKAAQIEVKHK